MILRDVADALAERGSATFSQIMVDVHGDRDLVAECLDWWRRRGQVRAEQSSPIDERCASHCSGCPAINVCSTDDAAAAGGATVFTWQGAPRARKRAGASGPASTS